MTYLNPFSILELPQDNPLAVEQPAFLKQERKRILAEFELEDQPTLPLAGRELDRATVLKLLTELEDPSFRAFHLQVYQFGELKDFLEKQDLTLFTKQSVHQLNGYEPSFKKWLGPHFAPVFNKQLLQAFSEKDWEVLRNLCQIQLPIAPEYQAASFKDTYRLIHTYLEEIRRHAEEIRTGTPPSGLVQERSDELLIDSLNQLPTYFQGSRDNYAAALEELALALYNEQQRVTLAVFVLKQAQKLTTGPDTQARLQDLLAQMDSQPTPLFDFSGKTASKSRLSYVLAGVGTFAILLLIWLI